MALLVRNELKAATRRVRQVRCKSSVVGKASPETMWTAAIARQPREQFFAARVAEEDRYWNARGMTKSMYKRLMKFRWQEDPKGPRIEKEKWVIHPGDVVVVVDGKGAGERGRVLECFYHAMVVKVEGVRLEEQEGVDPTSGASVTQFKEEWIPYQEVQLVDPTTDEPTAVELMELEDPASGEVSTFRISVETGSTIPVPEPSAADNKESEGDGKKDTPLDVAQLSSLEDGIEAEINKMALVKLKVLEEWFVTELEKLHTKDQHLRDSIAEEKKEYQYYTYQKALKMLYDRVEEEEPWLLPEVAALRVGSREGKPGRMPDFTAEQEQYRELRRGARFKLRHEMRPSDVESLSERYTRTTHRGTQLALHREIRERFEKGAMKRKAKTTGKAKAESKLASTFKMSPAEYIQDSLEVDAMLREQLEIGQGKVYQQENYVGWKPLPDRRRDELDEFDNRFAHMPNVMEEMRQLGHRIDDDSPPDQPAPPEK